MRTQLNPSAWLSFTPWGIIQDVLQRTVASPSRWMTNLGTLTLGRSSRTSGRERLHRFQDGARYFLYGVSRTGCRRGRYFRRLSPADEDLRRQGQVA